VTVNSRNPSTLVRLSEDSTVLRAELAKYLSHLVPLARTITGRAKRVDRATITVQEILPSDGKLITAACCVPASKDGPATDILPYGRFRSAGLLIWGQFARVGSGWYLYHRMSSALMPWAREISVFPSASETYSVHNQPSASTS